MLAICIQPPSLKIGSEAAFRIRNGVYNLSHLPQLAGIRHREWLSVSLEAGLPKIRYRVGKARVDMVTLEQGMLLLNILNYAPRPVFQSYSAYTPRLARLNESYFLGANAPDFVIFRLDYIDGRLPMMEDSLALIALLKLYRPVISERGFLLLQRDRKATAEAVAARAGSIPATLGTAVSTAGDDATTLAFIHVDLSAFGKIYTLLFREPALYVTQQTATGENQRHRLVRATAATGFVISPMIESNNDWVKQYFAKPLRSVSSIVVDTELPWERLIFQSDYSLSYDSIETLHADPSAVTSQLGGMLLYPGFNLMPVGTHDFKTVMEDGQESLFMHAPASLDFQPPPGIYSVKATYGIQRIAVDDPGCIQSKPDGVGVSIVLRHGGEETILSHNEINPFEIAADVGPQQLALAGVEVAEGDTLTYRVDAGPSGKNVSCDWTYVRDLMFVQSSAANAPASRNAAAVGHAPVNRDAYPGFNLAPLETGLRIIVDDGKKSVFLHAPATLSFAPAAGRYRITATFGLQSVAVSDPGCRKAGADGIGASLVLRHGSKETRLWHGRSIRSAAPATFGAHQAMVAAVDVAPGDRIDWRVDPGHDGQNTSCDWSYLRDVVFKRNDVGAADRPATQPDASRKGKQKTDH